MTINIPPALFGAAELYSAYEAEIIVPSTPTNVDFLMPIKYGPIYGLPQSAFIDLIIGHTINSFATANAWYCDEVDATFDGGSTWTKVINTETDTGFKVPGLGTRGWERLYGSFDVLSFLNLTGGTGTVMLRLKNMIRDHADIKVDMASFALRITNFHAVPLL